MKKLILVRHGKYGSDDKLNASGRKQMDNLSETLKSIINGESVIILTSTAPRASESAEIISKSLNVPFEEHEILWSDNGHPEDIPKVLELVKFHKEKSDILILVTHLEYMDRFPTHFASKELGVAINFQRSEKGCAFVIDCAEKTMSKIDAAC